MAHPTRALTFNQTIRDSAEASVLCWLATANADGAPSVSPKEIFALRGENSVVIADIASAGSVQNISANPACCVSFIDVFRQKGFKLKGSAHIVASSAPNFTEIGKDVLAKAGNAFPVRGLIIVSVHRIERIWAPSYTFFPEKGEAAMMQAAYSTYGVQPVN